VKFEADILSTSLNNRHIKHKKTTDLLKQKMPDRPELNPMQKLCSVGDPARLHLQEPDQRRGRTAAAYL